MDSATAMVFWIGVVMQVWGFVLAWQKLARVDREVANLRTQKLSGNLFVSQPVFPSGRKPTLTDRVERLEAQVEQRADAEVRAKGFAHEDVPNVRSIVARLHKDPSDRIALVLFITGLVLSAVAGAS